MMISTQEWSSATEAVKYAFAQLTARAGVSQDPNAIFSELGISVHYTDQTDEIHSSPALVVRPATSDDWRSIINLNSHKLDWAPVEQLLPRNAIYKPDTEKLPVLFWSRGYVPGQTPPVELQRHNVVIWNIDIIATTLFMLTRWEETVVSTRDQHGRFPATASVAYQQGFLDRPIVDEYALILQAWIQVLCPGWTPATRSFTVKLSHDIDHVRQFTNLSQAGRTMVGDLVKRHSPGQAAQALYSTLAGIFTPERDPYLQGIYDLASLSEQHGLESAFYFMATDPGPNDIGYDPASEPVHNCIEKLLQRGHEIGFHPGYSTLDDPQRFMVEKSRMDALLSHRRYGGRQHYLRFRTPDTWRQWEAAALAYDSTLSYADHEGFRCGTCYPYHPFDLEQDRQLDLVEIPLIVMDGTLKNYRGLTPAEGEERIMILAQRCHRVKGVFSLLWHNTSLQGEWEPWAAMYRRVLPRLAAMVGSNSSVEDRVTS
jgi:hypothetical protein